MAILTEDRPPKKRQRKRPEDILRASMVLSYHDKFGNDGRLVGTFSETISMGQGAVKNSLGNVRGVSDLLYFGGLGIVGIEIKAVDTYHLVEHLREQAVWLASVPFRGWFCDNYDDFWTIIDSRGEVGGIDPIRVLDKLSYIKTVSVKWPLQR